MVVAESKNRKVKEAKKEREFEMRMANMTQEEKNQMERLMTLKRDGADHAQEAKRTAKRTQLGNLFKDAYTSYDAKRLRLTQAQEILDKHNEALGQAVGHAQKSACKSGQKNAVKEFTVATKEMLGQQQVLIFHQHVSLLCPMRPHHPGPYGIKNGTRVIQNQFTRVN